MYAEHEVRIEKYLKDLLDSLEKRLQNPKNTWKRREDLKDEIRDVQKRLNSIRPAYQSDRPSFDESRPRRSAKPYRKIA